MQFSQSKADLFNPDSCSASAAIERTTQLGIGAHQDDLEFMALHGILECFQREDSWFSGITCTDGAGSSRTGPYAGFSDTQMRDVRVQEQRTAARIGQYGFMAQLDHPSTHAKDARLRTSLVDDLLLLFKAARPRVVYTHNPFDKHVTHIGVLHAVLEAIRLLPAGDRPEKVFGCEVWRGLDWLPDSLKQVHDVSAHPNLAAALNGVFDSQIAGGKRYDCAVEGRRLANATFLEAHAVDAATRVSYAIDLSALANEPEASLEAFVDSVLDAFSAEVRAAALA